MGLDSLNIEHWWKAVAAAGVALCVAAVAAQHNQLLLLGLGTLSCGVGEWINRPLQQTVMQQGYGGINGILTGYPWKPKPLGLMLDGIGILLIVYGAVRIVMLA